MAGQRLSKRLTARTVETLATPGRHADGDGLYLTVRPADRSNGSSCIVRAAASERWGWDLRRWGLRWPRRGSWLPTRAGR